MPEPKIGEPPLVLALLDRLTDGEPGVTRDPPTGRAASLRRLKQSVRRDLEDLLNTRSRPFADEGLEELGTSLVGYGLPDLTAADLGRAEARAALARLIEEVIRRYEPRLRAVRVRLSDEDEPIDRTLRFRIEALLLVEPTTEPIRFDSAVIPTTGAVTIRGGADE
jgi:type VI secretion system protein ImpF